MLLLEMVYMSLTTCGLMLGRPHCRRSSGARLPLPNESSRWQTKDAARIVGTLEGCVAGCCCCCCCWWWWDNDEDGGRQHRESSHVRRSTRPANVAAIRNSLLAYSWCLCGMGGDAVRRTWQVRSCYRDHLHRHDIVVEPPARKPHYEVHSVVC